MWHAENLASYAEISKRDFAKSLLTAKIWREIKAQGYPGSPPMVYYFLAPLRRAATGRIRDPSPVDHFSAKDAVWLFIRHFDDLDEKEQEELAAIRQASATAGVYEFVVGKQTDKRSLAQDEKGCQLASQTSRKTQDASQPRWNSLSRIVLPNATESPSLTMLVWQA